MTTDCGFLLDTACSEDDIVCKTVKYLDDDLDGIIEVGEPIEFRVDVEVQNASGIAWTNTTVEDRFGAEIDVTSATPSQGMATLTTEGGSDKEFLKWDVGMLAPGETATLVLAASTDLNPAGHQEYTECSLHEFNSGAVLKFLDPDSKQHSFETGSVVASVLTVDLLGDCDGDGWVDWDEVIMLGSDPHSPDCLGQAPTILGTADDDILVGTSDADVIVAMGGDDHIFGMRGNNLICAGDGNDVVIAGAGHDTVFGQRGDDLLAGGPGFDYCGGGSDSDAAYACEETSRVP